MKKIKRLSLILALVLTFSSCFGLFASAANIEDFVDVPSGAWYTKELNYATEKGLVHGISDVEFAPAETMSRSQVITILWRAFSGEEFTGTKFTDVPADKWFTSAVYWGVENGVTSGTSATTFDPTLDITRQDLATMLGRYIVNNGYELEDAANSVTSFNDASLISTYAKEYVEFMRAKGILKGDTSGNVNPRNPVTRAEGMALIVRTVAAINGDDLNDWTIEDDSENENATPPADDNDNNEDTSDDIPPTEDTETREIVDHYGIPCFYYVLDMGALGIRSRYIAADFPIVEAVSGVDYSVSDGKPNPIDKMPTTCFYHNHRYTVHLSGRQSTATEGGLHVVKCLDCGEVFGEGSAATTTYNHNFQMDQFVEPTETTNGFFVYICECCKFYEKVEIPYDEYYQDKFLGYATYNETIDYGNAWRWCYCNISRMKYNCTLDWNEASFSTGIPAIYESSVALETAMENEAKLLMKKLNETSKAKYYYFNILLKEIDGKTVFKIVYKQISPNG